MKRKRKERNRRDVNLYLKPRNKLDRQRRGNLPWIGQKGRKGLFVVVKR